MCICLVDGYLFNLYFRFDDMRKTILYIVVHIVLWVIEKEIYKNEQKTRREDFGFLSLWIPIFGFFIRALGEFIDQNIKTQNEIVVDEYQKYVNFIRGIEKKESMNFENEINTMSILDELKFASSENKKKSIISLIFYDIDQKVFLLKKGLLDEDKEVSHYCAATLNMIEQEFENAIHDIKDKYSIKREQKYIDALVDMYERYLNSGIVDSQFRIVELKEYKKIINEAIKLGEIDYSLNLKLIDIDIELGLYEDAKQRIEELKKDSKLELKSRIKLMKLFFKTGKYNDITSIAKEIISAGYELDEDESKLVKYWSK